MSDNEQKRAPENTKKSVKNNPSLFFAEGLLFGSENAILRQEAQGQESFVNSETLPVKINNEDKKILEKAGIKFGEQVAGDELFQYVALPTGWKKILTEHSMWSKLIDEKGRERASIFYKAAFYDREAYMSLSRRFNISRDYDRLDKENVAITHITDCGKIIYSTKALKLPEERNKKYDKILEEIFKEASGWLNKNYPDWENSNAYWD